MNYLLYNRLTLAKHKLNDPANQIQQIENIKIGVLPGSTYVGYAKQAYPNATLVYFDTQVEALEAVKKNEITSYFGDSASVSYLMQNSDNDINLYVSVSELKNTVDPIAIAVSPKYPDLVNWINLALTLREPTPNINKELN